jgi:hypothetical protein
VQATALDLARKLMFKFVRLVDTSVGKVSESASQRFQAYKELVAVLEQQQTALCMPLFGGTTVSKNDALDANEDLVQPQEKIDGLSNNGDTNTFGGG